MAIEIPEEMVIEILSRLPAESLLRFRCVSKLWRSLISHPKFTLSSPSQRHLYAAHHYYSEFYSYDDERASFTGPIRLKQMLLDISNKEMNKTAMWHHVQISGSCNGLLLVSYHGDLYLWNPTIRQCTKVLSLQAASGTGYYPFANVFGLCYDSYADDYKTVMVAYDDGSVIVISFRRKKWDKTICSPLNMDVDERYSLRCGPIVNEKLHWMTKNRILYFDPLIDEFGGFPMPEEPNNGQYTDISGMGVLEGCLCMARYIWEVGDGVELPGYLGDECDFTLEVDLDEAASGFIEVFVMKQHGVVESWTRAFIISKDLGILPGPCYGWLVPLCFPRDDEGLVSVTDYPLLVYDPNGMLRRDDPLVRNQHCSYVASYVESLASPAAYGHEEDWVVQGPNAWKVFFLSDTDFEDSSIEEDYFSIDTGSDSDWESFHSTKEDSSIEEEDTFYGYCSDKESFHSIKEDSSIEEEDNSMF